MNYYQQSIAAIIEHLKTNIQTGLTQVEAQKRLKKYGPNTLPDVKQKTWFSIFLSQFTSPLIYILLIAAVIMFFVGEDKKDAFIISGILLFNAIIGAIQEGRTQKIIESLKRFIKAISVVLRDDKKIVIDDSELVVGDIIILQAGERVPADARVIQSNNLQVDESTLTGESVAIHKISEPITDTVMYTDRTNMVYRGTYIMAGSGQAIVVGIGTATEIGKIHLTVEEITTEIPLRKELDRLSYIILLFILVVCVLLFFIGIFMGRPFAELLTMLTALFICVVPEGLPVVLTLVLVTGTYRMAQQYVLVRNLQAVETLGRTNVIVIDKTGTLTRNEMIATQVFSNQKHYVVTGQGYYKEGEILLNGKPISVTENSQLYHIGIASSLLHTAEISYVPEAKLFTITGEPTEAALYILSQKMGLEQNKLEKTHRKLYEIPFDTGLRYHAGFFEHKGDIIAYVISAPEMLLTRTTGATEEDNQVLTQLLHDGLRVIAFGMKKFSINAVPAIVSDDGQDINIKSSDMSYWTNLLESNIELLGFVGIQDSIRTGLDSIVKQVRDAGLQIIMATGDHQQTALYVARKTNIFQEGDTVINGSNFNNLSDEDLLTNLNKTTVFSRVAPEQKMRIISLFHKQGKIVAMTGDGINDAPSLVAADLGIAMGGIGSEVAKAAADLVLLDDSFVNIINAIEQGRHIFYTLRRVILYFFATNMGEVLIVSFALITNLPLPITAAQILWLNLITDGFLDIGLSMEPKESGLLAKNWLQKKQKLVDNNLLIKTIYMAIPMGIGSTIVFYFNYADNLAHARTMTLITMAMFQWFNAWNCRSETKSLLQIGLFTNKWLILATTFVLSLQFLLLYAPFMEGIFKTVPLSLSDWIYIITISSSILFIEEGRKWFVRRYSKHG